MKTLAFNFSQDIIEEVVKISVVLLEEMENDESENAPCLCNACIAQIVLQVFLEYVESIGSTFEMPTKNEDINLN
jgi:hypothetical protein